MKCVGVTLLLAAAATAAGCDGYIWMRARVINSEGQPIKSASVKMTRLEGDKSYERTTDLHGCSRLGGSGSPGRSRWTLTVKADGYQPIDTEITGPGNPVMLFILEPLSAGSVSAYRVVTQLDGCAA